MGTLTTEQIAAAHLTDWHGTLPLRAVFSTADFTDGLAFVNAIGAAAEAANHHPDITLRWGQVEVELASHDVGGITDRDVSLARVISQLAHDRGLKAQLDG